MSILSELLWSTLGIVYVPAKIIKEERDAKKHEAEFEQRYGGSEQFGLMLKSTEELSELLDFPIEDIPLSDDANFITGEFKRTRTARERRDAYAVAAILRKRGKKFLPVDPLTTTDGGKEFLAYVNGWKKLPKEILQSRLELWDKRNRRFKELSTILDLNKGEFEKILGREMLSFDNPIFNATSCGSSCPILWFDQYKAMAIAEILEREKLPSLTYGGQPVPYKTRKKKLDRILELTSMEFSKLEEACGFAFSDATVATRKKAIDLICDKEVSVLEGDTDLRIDTDTNTIDMEVLYEYLCEKLEEEAEAKRREEREKAEREREHKKQCQLKIDNNGMEQAVEDKKNRDKYWWMWYVVVFSLVFYVPLINIICDLFSISSELAIFLYVVGILLIIVSLCFILYHHFRDKEI